MTSWTAPANPTTNYTEQGRPIGAYVGAPLPVATHTHIESDVTNLTTDLTAKADASSLNSLTSRVTTLENTSSSFSYRQFLYNGVL